MFAHKLNFFALVVSFVFSSLTQAQSSKLEFSELCTEGETITVSAVGDILLHGPLQKQAFNDPQRFGSLWPNMVRLFKSVDIAYANFEGPAAENLTSSGKFKDLGGFKYDQDVYSSYPMFNYHPLIVQDILKSGIDIVSTANNHSLDRRKKGADLTIQAMQHFGLKYTGTRPADAASHPWHSETVSKGKTIAWLACTFSTNGIPDSANQVLMCYQDRAEVLQTIKELVRDPKYAAVIVTPHWGNEYVLMPSQQEILLARQMIDAGALAVIGTHPHVIQPWEKYTSQKSHKEGLIVYSTGNFVSGQFHRIPTQVGMMIGLQLVQDQRSNQLKIKSASYLPLLMKHGPIQVDPIYDDSMAAQHFSEIWQKMYPIENRISDPNNLFPVKCR